MLERVLERVAPSVFLLRGWSDFKDISCNAYFLVSSSASGNEAVVVDCGNASAETARGLKAAVKELGCSVAAVYCTHGHFDHVGGVNAFSSQVPVFLDEKDFYLIPDEGKARFAPLKDKKIEFGSFALEVLSTPGHTPGSACFWDGKKRILFSGDTLFAGSARGRTDFDGGDEREMVKSLSLIKKLGWKLLCPGHDEVERA